MAATMFNLINCRNHGNNCTYDLKDLLIPILYTVRREFLDTPIIYIVSSCTKASESCNTVMERQFYELSEYVRFLKLDQLIKCTA